MYTSGQHKIFSKGMQQAPKHAVVRLLVGGRCLFVAVLTNKE